MSSYFSRLIQQTEIAVGTGETNSRTFQPNETTTPLRDEVAVFEAFEPIEEIQAIATSQEEQFARQENFQIKGVGNEEEKFSLMGKHKDAQTRRAENRELSTSSSFFNQNAADRHESSSPKSARKASISSGDSPQSKQGENWTELSAEPMLPDHHQGTRLNFPNEEPKVRSEKILESRTDVVQQTQTSPETYLPKPPVHSEEHHTLGESKRVKTTPQLKAIPQEHNLLPTRQVNLQTVREWVGGTENSKLNTELNTEPLPISETQPQERPNSAAEIGNSSLNPQLSQFTDSQPQPNPNFMLSIGTISLTVEAPQTEVTKPALPPMKSQQEVKPVSPTSRLNRHYLRL